MFKLFIDIRTEKKGICSGWGKIQIIPTDITFKLFLGTPEQNFSVVFIIIIIVISLKMKQSETV